MKRALLIGVTLLPLLACVSCSIKQIAIDKIASSLAESGDLFGSDDDPELIRDAAPFALKTMEALLAEVPDHPDLLLAACRGFTEYSYAFIQCEADLIEPDDYRRSVALRDRALRMYLRARGYGLRALEREHPGITEELMLQPEEAASRLTAKEIDFIYWTGAAWGLAISQGKDRPELVADAASIWALMRRALAIDESYERGAIHEVMIDLESLESLGGDKARARMHFERAVELTEGNSASPYVTLALSVSISDGNRREFEELLGQALEIDPDADPSRRLANLIIQNKARVLIRRVDDLFLE